MSDVTLVEAVAAALVEPAAGLPGAAAVGIANRVEAVLADYPRFAPAVAAALDWLAAALGDPRPVSIESPAPVDPRSASTDRPALADLSSASADPPAPTGPRSAPADLRVALAELERDRPDLFGPLLEVIVSAWALSEPVWAALGYAGQRDLDPAAHPIPEDLFQPLLARGPRWRQPPEVTE